MVSRPGAGDAPAPGDQKTHTGDDHNHRQDPQEHGVVGLQVSGPKRPVWILSSQKASMPRSNRTLYSEPLAAVSNSGATARGTSSRCSWRNRTETMREKAITPV